MLFPGILQPEMLATLKERNAGSKTIYTKNLSYSVERADLYVLFIIGACQLFFVLFF